MPSHHRTAAIIPFPANKSSDPYNIGHQNSSCQEDCGKDFLTDEDREFLHTLGCSSEAIMAELEKRLQPTFDKVEAKLKHTFVKARL